MRARVYRHLDARTTFLGLAFPIEWGLVIMVLLLGTELNQTAGAAIACLAVYGGLRLLRYGRPDNFLQHWVLHKIRIYQHGGRFSCSARARVPRFPYGGYHPHTRRRAS